MQFEKSKEQLRNVAITITTPFTSDLSEIDSIGLEKNLKYLIANDVKMIVPCGNTGEFYSLAEQEWNCVVNISKNVVNENAALVAGVGNSIKSVLMQLETCDQMGYDGAMVMYPQHVFSSEEGILNYYRAILESFKDTPMVLYKKGPLLSDNVLEKLVGYPNLVGVKYAFGRIVDFSKTVQRIGRNIVWSCGTAERFAPFFWLAGARGITSGLANFAPKISQRMIDALRKGDFEEAMQIQNMISEFEFLREGRAKANNVPLVKTVMDHVGLVGGDCRPPIHRLSEGEKGAAISAISQWGFTLN